MFSSLPGGGISKVEEYERFYVLDNESVHETTLCLPAAAAAAASDHVLLVMALMMMMILMTV